MLSSSVCPSSGYSAWRCLAFFVNRSRLRAERRVRPIRRTVEPGALHPSIDDAGVLARRQTAATLGRLRTRVSSIPGQHWALIEDETWTAVGDQLAANAGDHRGTAKATEPSLLAGLPVGAHANGSRHHTRSKKADAIATTSPQR